MIKLTAPNGDPVEVSPNAITSMFPNDKTFHKDAKSVLVIGGAYQAVKESLEEIDGLLKGAKE